MGALGEGKGALPPTDIQRLHPPVFARALAGLYSAPCRD